MKISDLDIDTTNLTEAPVSGLKQGLRSLGVGALDFVGARDMASNLGGKVEVGNKANQLYTKFNKFLGRQNITVKDATAGDLKDFLLSVNVSDKYVPQPDTEVLVKDELNDIMMQVAKDSFRKSSRSVPSASDQDPTSPPSAPVSRSASAGTSSLESLQKAILKLPNEDKTKLISFIQKTLKQEPSDKRIEPTLNPSSDNVIPLRARA